MAFQGRGKGWCCGTASTTPVLAVPLLLLLLLINSVLRTYTLLVFNLVMPEKHLFQAEVLLPKKQMLLSYGTLTVLLQQHFS